MNVVTGITGRVGSVVAETLLASGAPVRGVIRSADKGQAWAARGCEIAVVADAGDAPALTDALTGATGVFLMVPPDYDPAPGFPQVHRLAEAAATALAEARPARVVLLSTVGAHVPRFNLLNNAAIFEKMLGESGLDCAFLRAAWFMENAGADLAAARAGHIESMLAPVDRAIDMVSARDIGRVAADLLGERWHGQRIVELAGPKPISPADIAAVFGEALDRPVNVTAIPRDEWDARARADGMTHPEAMLAMLAMLDGFNDGWLAFEHTGTERRTGTTPLTRVINDLVAKG